MQYACSHIQKAREKALQTFDKSIINNENNKMDNTASRMTSLSTLTGEIAPAKYTLCSRLLVRIAVMNSLLFLINKAGTLSKPVDLLPLRFCTF